MVAFPFTAFLPERDYLTFGSLLADPSVCRMSVTFVHPTQGVEAFGNISSPLCMLASVQNFTEIVLGEPLHWER